jgi:hypothetical protein
MGPNAVASMSRPGELGRGIPGEVLRRCLSGVPSALVVDDGDLLQQAGPFAAPDAHGRAPGAPPIQPLSALSELP